MLLSFQLRQRTDDTVPMNDVFFIHHCRHACFSCCSALSVYSSASKLCYSCIKLKYFLWITWYGVSYVFTYMHTMYFPCKPLLSICCIDFSLPPNTTFSQDRLKLLISFSGILSLSLSLSHSLTHSLTVCLSLQARGKTPRGEMSWKQNVQAIGETSVIQLRDVHTSMLCVHCTEVELLCCCWFSRCPSAFGCTSTLQWLLRRSLSRHHPVVNPSPETTSHAEYSTRLTVN